MKEETTMVCRRPLGIPLAVLLLLTQTDAGAGTFDGPILSNPAADREIQRGFRTLGDLTKDKGKYENYAKSLGFTSAEQATRATPGKPLKVFWVRVDRLEKFQEGDKPTDFIEDRPNTLLIPVIADGEIRSSLMMAESEETKAWRIIGQGSSNLLRDKSPEYIAKIDAVVLIPDLRLRFLARNVAGDLILIPMRDYPLFKLKGGTELPSAAVFKNLAPFSRRIADGLADSIDESKRGRASQNQQSQ
jgi:hypothetical protein